MGFRAFSGGSPNFNGGGAANQVTLWSGPTTLTGDAGFVWTGTGPTFDVTVGRSVQLGTVSTTTGLLKLANAASAFLTTIQAGNAAAARTYTWPTDFGAAGTVLTDAAGNGTLSWASAGALPAGAGSEIQYRAGASTFGAVTGSSVSGGVVTVSDLAFSGTTTVGLHLKSLTTTQKNAVSPAAAAGDMVYDSTLQRSQMYDGAAWHSHVRLDGDTMTGALSGTSFSAPLGIFGSGAQSGTGLSTSTNMVSIVGSGTTTDYPLLALENTTNSNTAYTVLIGGYKNGSNAFVTTWQLGNLGVADTLSLYGKSGISVTNQSVGLFTANNTAFATTRPFTSDSSIGLAGTNTNGATEISTFAGPELLTLSTGGTTTNTVGNLAPANSIIKSILVRVGPTITGSGVTGFTIGVTGGNVFEMIGTGTTTLTTLTSGTTYVLVPPLHSDQYNATGTTLTVTAIGGTPSAGAVRLVTVYEQYTAPTS